MKKPVGLSPFDDPHAVGPALLTQAEGILAQEAAKFARRLARLPNTLAPTGQSEAVPNLELPLAALPGIDIDRLRRHAHEVIETFLTALSPKAATDDRAVVLRCATRVDAGDDAVATLRIANEDPTPLEVSLYSSNFVADNGYDIPASRITFSPRAAKIAPKADAAFEVRVSVPAQAPSGSYSGLVQAFGCKYLKAVVVLEVK